jgi:glycine cleavage system aminomethyltransferase T
VIAVDGGTEIEFDEIARREDRVGGPVVWDGAVRDGGTLTDGHGHHPYVTTAGSAPSLGKHVLLAYLPVEQAVIGTELAVSYMEELYPVVVGSVDATPLFDPANERMR